eukprot:GHUV01037058.1.p1 GENE.GHUV01037058.1~~GHUV01037058.1.p1  ORF type:complete len:119 (-),score=14.16 GHUV01037058.1:973-1329(-)
MLTTPCPHVSCTQVRFQGYKGVLSRYSGLVGRAIELRPSMNKFGSKHPKLEVVSVAACRPAYLNRQVILMMNYNGVPREVRGSKCWAYNWGPYAWCNVVADSFEGTVLLGVSCARQAS